MMNAAAAAKQRPIQKLPPMQSSPRKVRAKVSASKSPEKKSKSPAGRPKRRPESTSAAPRSSTGQAQGQSNKQQQQQVDNGMVAAAHAQKTTELPGLPKPNTELERSFSEGNRSGIQWIIHIDCPGGHAAPLKIITGLETREEDDDESDDDADDDNERVAMDQIQNKAEMKMQSSVQVPSDLTSSSKSLRPQPQNKSMRRSGEYSSGDNHNRLQKLEESLSSQDLRGLQTGLHYLAQEAASDDDDISGDDTIEESEAQPDFDDEEEEEKIEEKDDRSREQLEEVQGDDYYSTDDDSTGRSETSESDGGRYSHARNLSNLPEDFDEDDQSIDPLDNFSPRTSQDSDDDLIIPSSILTEPSTVLQSCNIIEFSAAGLEPDVEEFNVGGNSKARKSSSRINFGKSLSALPEEGSVLEQEGGGDKVNRSSGRLKSKKSRRHIPAAEKTSRRIKNFTASMPDLQLEKDSSARYKSSKSRRQEPAAGKSSRPVEDSNASIPELQNEKDSADRSKRSKARRQKPAAGKSSRPVEDSNASMPELQPVKDSSSRSKSGNSRRHKSTPEKTSSPVEDSNASMPELQPEKDSSDRSKIGKARRHKSTPEGSSRSVEDLNVSMPELQPEKDSSGRSKRGKARRHKSTPEGSLAGSSRSVEDFNASLPELHRSVTNLTEDYESDFFGLQGILTSAVLKKESENRSLDQGPTRLLASINSITSASESSSSAYNIEQQGRNAIQRTKSAPFVQLDVSAKEGFQVCENKESGEKKYRRRAPSRSKSDDGMLNFAQLDLTGNSGVRFVDNETVMSGSQVAEKRSGRRAHNRSHSADDSMLNFAQFDLMGYSGVQFVDNETVNLPESPPAVEKKSSRPGPGRLKSLDLPKPMVDEKPDIPPSLDKNVQTPTHIEAPTPRSIRRLVRMGSDLISNRKLNKSNSNLKASDAENKKRFLSFGSASFSGSHIDLGDLLDDDDSAFDSR